MAAAASVTVVLPLVPVTATTGISRWRQANSISLQTGTPPSRASVIGAATASGTPGLVTTRSMPASRSAIPAASDHRRCLHRQSSPAPGCWSKTVTA